MPPRSPSRPSAPRPQLLKPTRKSGSGVNPPVHPFDLAHGTDTGGLIPGTQLLTGHPSDQHVTAYYGVAPSILRGLIDLWLDRTAPPFPVERYTFLDIGAGKGRALILAAQCPFLEVLGVELNPGLAAIARNNIAAALARDGKSPQLLAPIRLLQADALTLTYPETPTLAFLFHPFEAPLLRKLLRSIETHFAARPGQIDIAYVNTEHGSVLDRHPAFHKLWEGRIPMSTEDHIADLREIAEQLEYGSTGDEHCALYRFTGRPAGKRSADPATR